MFGSARFELGESRQVFVVPTSSISYAPFGDSIFVVERTQGEGGAVSITVRQQIVQIGERRGDMAAITTGLKSGDEVATSGAFNLRPGAAVAINNTKQLPASEKPSVEDT
jgi:membrane fusion protein (multidrug efflux system)